MNTEKTLEIQLPIEDNGELTIFYLKKLAWSCVLVQAFCIIIFLIGRSFFHGSNNAVTICGLLAIAASLNPVFYALKTKRIPLIFSCLTSFNIAPIWFLYLEAILPGYDSYVYNSPDERMTGFFWISVFQLSGNLFYVLLWKRLSRLSLKTFSFIDKVNISTKFYNITTLVAFVVPLVAFYYFYNSFDVLWKAMTAGRSGGGSTGGLIIHESSVGSFTSLMLPLNMLWSLTPLFSVIAYFKSSRKLSFQSAFSLLMGAWVIFSFFLSGSRGDLIQVVTPVVFFAIFYNWHKGTKFWIPLILVFFFLIGIMELQVRFRGNLLDVIADPAKAAKANDLKSATTFDPSQSHRDNNMYLLCLLVKGYPDKYPYEGFNDFYAILVNPIPRYFWPQKPIMTGAQDLIYQPAFIRDGPINMTTTSLTYCVVGEAYKSKGLLGILAYTLIYGMVLLFLDGIVYYTRNKEPLAIGLLGTSMFLCFWGSRSFFALFVSLYPLLLFVFIILLTQLFKKK